MREKFLKRLKDLISRSDEINYPFFAIIFVAIASFSISHVYFENSSFTTGLLFILHSICQAALEVSLFVLIALFIKRISIFLYGATITAFFLTVIVHYVNFIMVRLMDIDISYVYNLFFRGGLKNLFVVHRALNFTPGVDLIILLALTGIILICFCLYFVTHLMAKKKPLKIRLSHPLLTGLILFPSLILLELFLQSSQKIENPNKYRKELPFCSTFIKNDDQLTLILPENLSTIRDEREAEKVLSSKQFIVKEKPNIYIFIVEALREDYLNHDVAPNICGFKKKALFSKTSYSGANNSQASWFTILNSNHPIFWTVYKNKWQNGSIPLKVLKKIGYKIRVFTSTELNFFKIDEAIFGKNLKLIDELRDFSKGLPKPAWKRDKKSLKALIKATASAKDGGNLFLIFLDSTHSEYSWPPTKNLKFSPVSPHINYVSLCYCKKELDLIKNRYRNAINYIDDLFGKFLKHASSKDIVVFTADHGEEFFEDGALFHCSHLNSFQTRVPIYYHFPDKKEINCLLSSHIDILPSIIHYLTGEENLQNLMDGESLFSKKRRPYTLAISQNMGEFPIDFIILTPLHKILARLPEIGSSFEPVTIRDFMDNPISDPLKKIINANFQDFLHTKKSNISSLDKGNIP